jgi:Tfp pilus assembly protein PilF
VTCVSCHMPTTTYMLVHARHDHSIRIPRPDLTVSLGVPNACNKCHADKPANWAAERVASWYGHPATGYQNYAAAFAASARGDSAAPRLLTAVARDTSQPAIARASAIERLAPLLDASTADAFDVIRSALGDRTSFVRRAAVDAVGEMDSLSRARLLPPLLTDSVRDVRVDAARALAGVAPVNLDEYVASEMFNADRPESRLNLSILFATEREYDAAEQQLLAAIAIAPRFVPAFVNLADVYRAAGRDSDSERALRLAVTLDSSSAAARHALGLYFIREKRLADAIVELSRAAQLAPDVARYGIVQALALDQAGRHREALAVLSRLIARHPFDHDALSTLVDHLVRDGNRAAALPYARRLAALEPQNAELGQLVVRLSGEAAPAPPRR